MSVDNLLRAGKQQQSGCVIDHSVFLFFSFQRLIIFYLQVPFMNRVIRKRSLNLYSNMTDS